MDHPFSESRHEGLARRVAYRNVERSMTDRTVEPGKKKRQPEADSLVEGGPMLKPFVGVWSCIVAFSPYVFIAGEIGKTEKEEGLVG